jgi:hypothetical protein
MIMKFSGITARRRIAGVAAGCTARGRRCSNHRRAQCGGRARLHGRRVSNTVSTTLGSARAYLNTHPGANQAVGAAFSQPRDQAAGTLRGYFTPIRRSTTT